MLPALIAVTAAAALGLIGWATFWLITDARERRIEKEAADRWLAHRRSLQPNRYLRDHEGAPE